MPSPLPGWKLCSEWCERCGLALLHRTDLRGAEVGDLLGGLLTPTVVVPGDVRCLPEAQVRPKDGEVIPLVAGAQGLLRG